MKIYFGKQFIDEDELKVKSVLQAFEYGYNIFETIKYDGKPIWIYDHLTRMATSSGIFCDQGFPEESDYEIAISAKKLYEINGYEKPMALKVMYLPLEKKLMMYYKPLRYTNDMYERGFKVSFARDIVFSKDHMLRIKSGNYMKNKVNLEIGRKQGNDEVIFLNERGNITEGSYTNIFFIKDREIITPDFREGMLEGLTKKFILKRASELGIKIHSISIPRDIYKECTEAFLTNSLMGIMPIRQFEEKTYEFKELPAIKEIFKL